MVFNTEIFYAFLAFWPYINSVLVGEKLRFLKTQTKEAIFENEHFEKLRFWKMDHHSMCHVYIRFSSTMPDVYNLLSTLLEERKSWHEKNLDVGIFQQTGQPVNVILSFSNFVIQYHV